MVGLVRALGFYFVGCSWTALVCLASLPFLVLPRKHAAGVVRVWARGVLWMLKYIIGLEYNVSGLRNKPSNRAIYAIKHQSAWETVAIFILFDDPVVVLKHELARVPIVGLYLQKAGHIAIRRDTGAKAIKSILNRACSGEAVSRSIVIFPEGHRVAPGAPTTYLSGVAALYSHLRLPVIPVAHNAGLFWPRCGLKKRPGCIEIEFLRPIRPGLDRHEFTAELERAIEGATARLIAQEARRCLR